MASLNDFLDSDNEYEEEEEEEIHKQERKIGDVSDNVNRNDLLKAVGITKKGKKQQEKELIKYNQQKQLKKQHDDEKIQKFGKKSLKKLSQPSDFYHESNVGIPQAAPDDDTTTTNDDDDTSVSFRDLASTLINTNTSLKQKLKESVSASTSGKLLEKPEDPVALARKNRIEGYRETNKKLTNTWSGTIKANLTAEHLHFPLNKEPTVTSTKTFSSKTPKRLQTELESNIQKVLLQSGANKDAVARYEAQLRAEAIENRKNKQNAAKNSNDKSAAAAAEEEERRMGLQMYYQQLKARRRAKIKSKSFRKIERQRKAELKEMEVAEMLENDPEAALDLEMKADRDRILERATLRHKADSKWAKKAKVKGLSKVPEIKRVLAEKARIGNELTRKMNAASSSLTSERGSETYDLDSENEDDVAVFAQDFDNNINGGNNSEGDDAEMNDDYDKGAALDAQREEREMEDEEMVEQVLRESADAKVSAPVFAGKSVLLSSTTGGRKVNVAGNVAVANTNLFKEVGFADIKDDIDVEKSGDNTTAATTTTATITTTEFASNSDVVPIKGKGDENPWLNVPAAASSSSSSKKTTTSKQSEEKDKNDNEVESDNMIDDNNESDDDDDDDENDRRGLDLISASEDQKRLVREAFADDESDVELELQREKDAEIEELAGVEKSDSNVLPGWGSWAGEGVVESQRAKERRLRREKEEEERRKAILEKVRTIRKDADLKHVVVNEKVDKKAAVYKARAVPKGVTPEHYERMLAVPVGREWQTSIAHRKMIMPKITVEKGKVIKPLSAPKKVSTPAQRKNQNFLKKATKYKN